MELKTAEELIKDHDYGNGKLDKQGVLDAMKEYALQEVKKHLEIASENFDVLSNKNAITNIKIELT